ncbi:hypothetical protein MBLNU230_g3117t1 [Neophaeotheca triangularis]
MASPVTDRNGGLDGKKDAATPRVEQTTQNSPKRKASEVSQDKPDTGTGKKKRRKVNHACVYCRRSHMTCDLERPCARCVKRDIGHLCHDEPRDPPKRGKSDAGQADIAPAPEGNELKPELAPAGQVNAQGNGDMTLAQANGANGGGPQIAQPVPVSPTQLQQAPGMNAARNIGMSYDWNNSGVQNQFQDMHHLHPNYMFNTSEVTNEYNLLNDFLSTSLLDEGALYNDDTQALFNDPLLATSSINALSNTMGQQGNANTQNQQQPQQPQQTHQQQQQQPPPQQQQQQQQQPPANLMQLPPQPPTSSEISRPPSTYPVDSRARDKFYMTAADPAGLSSAEDRLHKLLKAKYDAGMLKPFNYVKGYARLNTYMERNISRDSRVRILRQLERFRPKFREAMQTLTDMQLVLVEMWFERSLMEYDRVFASMAIPACCWRRTGEIFRGNREMAELINVPWEKLRDGKLAIHEIIAEDSLVSYWEKFGAIAFDNSQKAILTSCNLKYPTQTPESELQPPSTSASEGDKDKAEAALANTKRETVRCCFSFTIRRDPHNIPALIVGNFLPVKRMGR